MVFVRQRDMGALQNELFDCFVVVSAIYLTNNVQCNCCDSLKACSFRYLLVLFGDLKVS